MSTLSVPLSKDLEEVVEGLVQDGYGANKADVVRKALKKLAEDRAVEAVLQAQREIDEGKGLEGDLRELVKKI